MSSLFKFSPTYWDYWTEGSNGFRRSDPKDYKEPWFEPLEFHGTTNSYAVKSDWIHSKELFPLILVAKAFEPSEIIKVMANGTDYEFPALVYGFGVGIGGVGVGVGAGVGVRVAVGVALALAFAADVDAVVVVVAGVGIQNNDQWYIDRYKWNEFKETWKDSNQKHCLFDCLVFPEIGGPPVRSLIPWFMIEKVKEL